MSIQAPGILQPARRHAPIVKTIGWASVALALLIVVAALVWQGLTAQGNPDPTTEGINRASAILDTGILVFREGLEAILVLAALTASLVRTQKGYWKPVAFGAGLSFLASLATWFIVVGIISEINAPALEIQAATGLLAIIVLLVIMNWFFHKVYWAGWITFHNRRKQALTAQNLAPAAFFWGLALIGFTSVYREGFEVVLFLQSIRLRVGSHVVLEGVLIGLGLTSLVAMLTFVVQYRLPYRKMLVFTGIMLGAVLLVMVGEQVFEMQQANWMSATPIHIAMPEWLNVWFGIFPTVESLSAQVLAAILVIGSYFLARRVCVRKHSAAPGSAQQECIVPDCSQCDVPHQHQEAESPRPVQVTIHSTK